MSKETRITGQKQHRSSERSHTPTGSDTIPNISKSTMQEASEQQLNSYAASFSSSNSQDRAQRLRRSQSPTWQRSNSVSVRFHF